ncbi:hypothetical protein [Streptomyces hokutonensis]|uniref:hypothetical protein n=1 Tax=Streptomyces hokutonensis TaxID=1306990 RepID=UPI00131A2ECB|nr:hypothetical protein [Streptomyces hokutonensis]
MIQQTSCAEATSYLAAALINMPQQAPPVDRTQAAATGVPNAASGVEANIVAPPLLDWNTPWTGTGGYPYNPFGSSGPYVVF